MSEHREPIFFNKKMHRERLLILVVFTLGVFFLVANIRRDDQLQMEVNVSGSEMPRAPQLRAYPLRLTSRVPKRTAFDVMGEKNCLPDLPCLACFKEQQAHWSNRSHNGCGVCYEDCSCYCDELCTEITTAAALRPVKRFLVVPGLVGPRSVSEKGVVHHRIPRIIHVTHKVSITPDKTPTLWNISQQMKKQGWEYRFYSDADVKSYLAEHFPREVIEAYNGIALGIIRSDFFRLAVLTLEGGLSVDADTVVEGLDKYITSDVGYVTTNFLKEGWLSHVHSGFVATAPGHPAVVLAFEVLINSIRNRATSVELDGIACPHPMIQYSRILAYAWSGPVLVGYVINKVLGRDPFAHLWLEKYPLTKDGRDWGNVEIVFIEGWTPKPPELSSDRSIQHIHGNIRNESNSRKGQMVHYDYLVKAGHRGLTWGTQGLYKDTDRAFEDIRLEIAPANYESRSPRSVFMGLYESSL